MSDQKGPTDCQGKKDQLAVSVKEAQNKSTSYQNEKYQLAIRVYACQAKWDHVTIRLKRTLWLSG